MKLNITTVFITLIAFISGIVATAINTGDTYANEVLSRYNCPADYAQLYGNVLGSIDETTKTQITSIDKNSIYCCTSKQETINLFTKDDIFYGGYFRTTNGYLCEEATAIEACYICNGKYEWSKSVSLNQCAMAYQYETKEECINNNKAPKTYKVVFNTDGGNSISDIYVTDGNTFDAPTPYKTGYSFEYWIDTSNYAQYKSGTKIKVERNMELKAHYKPTAYNVTATFWNEGTKYDQKQCTISDDNKINDKLQCSVAVPGTKPEKTGYTYIGWSRDCGNSEYKKFVDGMYISNNSDFYACYEPKKYTITYDGNGGLYKGSETWVDNVRGPATYGQPYKTYSNDNFFVREGYTFVGWKDQNGTDWTGDIDKTWTWTYDYDVILSAQWKEKEITETPEDEKEPTDDENKEEPEKPEPKPEPTPEVKDPTDDEIKDPDEIKTGDIIISIVWVIGIGTLVYTVYYYTTRRNSI